MKSFILKAAIVYSFSIAIIVAEYKKENFLSQNSIETIHRGQNKSPITNIVLRQNDDTKLADILLHK